MMDGTGSQSMQMMIKDVQPGNCCVLYCPNGFAYRRDTNQPKTAVPSDFEYKPEFKIMFPVPEDFQRRKEWEHEMSRVLNKFVQLRSEDMICSAHFYPEDMSKKTVVNDERELKSIDCSYLSPQAIPVFFPGEPKCSNFSSACMNVPTTKRKLSNGAQLALVKKQKSTDGEYVEDCIESTDIVTPTSSCDKIESYSQIAIEDPLAVNEFESSLENLDMFDGHVFPGKIHTRDEKLNISGINIQKSVIADTSVNIHETIQNSERNINKCTNRATIPENKSVAKNHVSSSAPLNYLQFPKSSTVYTYNSQRSTQPRILKRKAQTQTTLVQSATTVVPKSGNSPSPTSFGDFLRSPLEASKPYENRRKNCNSSEEKEIQPKDPQLITSNKFCETNNMPGFIPIQEAAEKSVICSVAHAQYSKTTENNDTVPETFAKHTITADCEATEQTASTAQAVIHEKGSFLEFVEHCSKIKLPSSQWAFHRHVYNKFVAFTYIDVNPSGALSEKKILFNKKKSPQIWLDGIFKAEFIFSSKFKTANDVLTMLNTLDTLQPCPGTEHPAQPFSANCAIYKAKNIKQCAGCNKKLKMLVSRDKKRLSMQQKKEENVIKLNDEEKTNFQAEQQASEKANKVLEAEIMAAANEELLMEQQELLSVLHPLLTEGNLPGIMGPVEAPSKDVE